MSQMPSAERVREMYQKAQKRIDDFHIRTFPGQPGPIVLISIQYPGVWMEHCFDGILYARLNPDNPIGSDIAKNEMLLFLRNQTEDGRLPFNVMDMSIMKDRGYTGLKEVNYNQIQECVSFGRICMSVYEHTGDRDFLREAYEGCAKWDEWLCRNRMSRGKGLIELLCLYDTGHDNSIRLADVPDQCPDAYGCVPVDSDAVPMIAPDMNAVFYGDRCALADMAAALGLEDEAAQWRAKAEEVRRRMMELLYDPEDMFFYDLDSSDRLRKFRSVSITNVLTEHVVDQELFEKIYERHIHNPEEFWPAYPFPSMAVNTPDNEDHALTNCWGYYCQATTPLRAQLWMDFYGKSEDYDHVLRQWVEAYCREDNYMFAQELDPHTGCATGISEWYSSGMLLFMYAAKRLGYVK